MNFYVAMYYGVISRHFIFYLSLKLYILTFWLHQSLKNKIMSVCYKVINILLLSKQLKNNKTFIYFSQHFIIIYIIYIYPLVYKYIVNNRVIKNYIIIYKFINRCSIQK